MSEEKNLPASAPGAGVTVTGEALGEIVMGLMRPVIETMGRMLKNNTEALEQLASAQSVQNDRLEALERQIRLQTPVTGKQVKYLNDAIRMRARALLEKRGLHDDKKAVTALSGHIRKAVLARYGVSNMREIPRHEYGVAMSQVEMWNDMLSVHDVARAAQRRTEEGKHDV